MIDLNNLIEELKVVLEANSKTTFYKDLLRHLYDIYNRVSSDVIVEDYYIDTRQHYVSFGFADEEYSFEINVNNQYLEFRFFLVEIIFFEDDSYFNKIKEEILTNFFTGSYDVHHYRESNTIVSKELYWQNTQLQKYNILVNKKSKIKYIKNYKGKSFW